MLLKPGYRIPVNLNQRIHIDLTPAALENEKFVIVRAYFDLATSPGDDASGEFFASDVSSRASLSINVITAEKSSSLLLLDSVRFI